MADSTMTADGPDYSHGEANRAAGQLGLNILGELAGLPQYAGVRILSYGVEVQVVGAPTPAMRAAVARNAQHYCGSEIPVRVRSVRYSEQELQAVQGRIVADRREWATQGIEVSTCGIDLETNTMEIRLAHYSDHYRSVLLARYGDRVTVYPHGFSVVAI